MEGGFKSLALIIHDLDQKTIGTVEVLQTVPQHVLNPFPNLQGFVLPKSIVHV